MNREKFHSHLFQFNITVALLFICYCVSAQIPACRVNEEFRDSGPMCENCGPRCLAWSLEAKCYCKQGFSRFRGVCIANKYCPKRPGNPPRCPVNEEFSLEGGALCENCGPRCLALSSEPKCYCKPGFSRLTGVCIPNSECPDPETTNPHPCPEGEVFKRVGAECEFCNHRCDRIQRVPKCYCRPGHLRDSFGICVASSLCPA